MPLMYSLLLVFTTAFLGTALWLALARRRRWFDHPNHRSSHVIPTPKSGGAGFVFAYSVLVLAMYLAGSLTLAEFMLPGVALLLALMGFADDLRSLGIFERVGMQVLAAVLAPILLGFVPPLVFPWGELGPDWLRAILLVFGLVWLINLFNFMDGIDALAALEAIYYCLALALFASAGGATNVVTLTLGLALAVSGFLYFNLPPARLFMGDLGSNYLGYMLAILGGIAIEAGVANVWTLLVLLGVFIVDATATLLGRIRAGLVWYHAHRSHAYQLAALRFGHHGTVVALVALINLAWLLPLAWLTTRYEHWGLVLVLVAWAPLHVLGKFARQAPAALKETPQAST